MQDDSMSVRTPTHSELDTFKIFANPDFVNFDLAEPTSKTIKPPEFPQGLPPVAEEAPEAADAELPVVEEEQKQYEPDANEASEHVQHDAEAPPPEPYRGSEEDRELNEKAQKESSADVAIEKEALLYEIEMLEKQGLIKLHRSMSMENSLEEIQYAFDRANMVISTQQTVDWAKTSIKMGSGFLETILKRFGVSAVDGFSNNLCKDMTKFNKPLTRMYRKYWRKGSSSPEMELAMIVFGALAMTISTNYFMKPSTQAAASAGASASEATKTVAPPPRKPATMPEWAKGALAKPVIQGPVTLGSIVEQPRVEPRHFAQVPAVSSLTTAKQEDAFPEEAPPAPMPFNAVPVSAFSPNNALSSYVTTSQQYAQADADSTRRITLPTPKSSRRSKKDQPEELVF